MRTCHCHTMAASCLAAIAVVTCIGLWLTSYIYAKSVHQNIFTNNFSRQVSTAHPNAEGRSAKILCWVLTEQHNLDNKATAVRDTWSRRCDKFLFFSSKTNATFPTIGLDVPKGRAHLTTKVLLAFSYCFKLYGKEFDWFLKADDDTYVIVENLRLLVQSRDPEEAVYFGYRFKPYTPQGYMSGGAGYLLSRESLKRLVLHGLLGHACETFWSIEDLDIGRCLSSVGVKAMDSLDRDGKERFHPLSLDSYFGSHDLPNWVYTYAYHPILRHYDCCSNLTISFHYIRPHLMYILDYLIYRLRH